MSKYPAYGRPVNLSTCANNSQDTKKFQKLHFFTSKKSSGGEGEGGGGGSTLDHKPPRNSGNGTNRVKTLKNQQQKNLPKTFQK